ncbi:MAG: hypothetical protein R3A10_23145 [Caldilineaceae bacterium]
MKIGETTGPDNGRRLRHFNLPLHSSIRAFRARHRPATAYILTDILSDRAATGGLWRGSVLDLPFPAAAKTGTTTDWRDNWTIGYTTERIVGVWVGIRTTRPCSTSAASTVRGPSGATSCWRPIPWTHQASAAAQRDRRGDLRA